MVRRRTHIPLNIFLNGRLVCRLKRQASGAIDFEYDGMWLAWEHAFPVSLSLPLREDRFVGDPVVAVFDSSASSRTGDASQPDMTAMSKTISLVSPSQP